MRSAWTTVGLAAWLGFAVALRATPAIADPGELNPIFAPLTELPRAALDGANGKGIKDLTQNATLTVNGVGPQQQDSAALTALPTIANHFNGDNAIAAGAFSDSRVFAAIVQNNGSFVNIQNMLAVEVNMTR